MHATGKAGKYEEEECGEMSKAKALITQVNLANIRDNHPLSISVIDKDVDRSAKTIKDYGVLTPLVISRYQDGNHQVVSGECELMALREMEVTVTEAVVVDCQDEVEANKLTLLLSSLKHGPNALSEGILLKKLLQAGNFTQADAAHLTGKSISWVSKRLALTERLETSVVDLVAAKRFSPYIAQEVARLPREIQYDFAVKIIKDSLPRATVEKLVGVYNNPGTGEATKGNIIENPKEAARCLDEFVKLKNKPKPEDPENIHRCRSELLFLLRLIGELEGLLASLAPEQSRSLYPLLLKVAAAAIRLNQLLQPFCKSEIFPR